MPNSFVARDLQKRMQMCSDREFTGLIEVGVQSDAWRIYFVLGRVVWLNANRHPLRQWERQLSIYNPVFHSYINQPASSSYKSWNYGALAELVKSGRFPSDCLFNMAEAAIAENFFDLLQVGTQNSHRTGAIPTYRTKARDIGHLPDHLMYHDRAWQKAQQVWTKWEQAALAEISPDWVPGVVSVEALRSRTSPQTFETLSTFMNGSNTLKDLALTFKQPLPTLTQAVLPYIQKGLLKFSELPNLVETFEHAFYPDLFVNDLCAIDLLNREPVETVPTQEPLSEKLNRKQTGSEKPASGQRNAGLSRLRLKWFL